MKANIIKDPDFDYLRVDPVPTQSEVEKFYLKDFYRANEVYFNDSSLLVQEEQSEFFNQRWDAIYKVCEDFFEFNLKEKKLFDIGFGFAQALIYFNNKGLKVSGLEPSLEGYQYAKSKGLNVYNAEIENFQEINDKFDIVFLNNVLEHLRKPADTLNRIKEELLLKNGLLVIDVPNDFNDFQIIADQEYNLDQWWVYPPNHINYFSHDSLKKLLENCGYKIFYCTSSFPIDIFLLFGDQYVGNPNLGSSCHQKRMNFEKLMVKYGYEEKLKNLYHSFAELNLGRQITVYATPK